MKENRRSLIYVLLLLLLVLILGGISYAYFSAIISGKESASTIVASSGSMNIVYANGSGYITASNLAPDAAAFANKTFTVKGNNTTSKDMGYQLSIIIDSNTFSSGAITYKLDSTNTDSNGTVVPAITTATPITGTTTAVLGTGKFVNATNKVHTYTLHLYFLDNSADQSADMQKSITLHVGIEALQV